MNKYCERCGRAFQASDPTRHRFCSSDCRFADRYPPAGTRFGKVVVVEAVGRNHRRTKLFRLRCDCGNELVRPISHYKLALVVSCGCVKREKASIRLRKRTTHGMTGTREFKAFHRAKQRCGNPRDRRWDDYGGRGIEFRFESLEQFLACLGPHPGEGYSLDRIDNNGHYEPGNVRWATDYEQRTNKRPRNRNRDAAGRFKARDP